MKKFFKLRIAEMSDVKDAIANQRLADANIEKLFSDRLKDEAKFRGSETQNLRDRVAELEKADKLKSKQIEGLNRSLIEQRHDFEMVICYIFNHLPVKPLARDAKGCENRYHFAQISKWIEKEKAKYAAAEKNVETDKAE